MNDFIVPVDLTEEEKTVLARLSIRQFIIIVPAGVLSLIQLILLNLPFITGWVDLLLRFIAFLIINAVTFSLAFVKLDKRDQYLSDYVMSKYKFIRSQKIYRNV